MITQVISVGRFEEYVTQIICSFSDQHEFEVRQLLEMLYFTYKVLCNYQDLVLVLDKMVTAGRIVNLIPRQKYKTQFFAAEV